MRVLFSTTAGAGHFGPSIPVARACAAAGHEVLVAAPASFAADVARAGFRHHPFPDVPPEQLGPIFARLPSLPREEANRTVVSEVFGRLDAQAALPELLSLTADWRPDVIVRDPVEFGSMAAARTYGVPDVQVAIGFGALTDELGGWLTEPLTELAERAGLPSGLDPQQALGAPTLTSVPASLDESPGATTPAGPVFRYRTATPLSGAALPATWGDPSLPLVYVSFGSVAGGIDVFAGVYAATLAALAALPIRVLMTTGSGLAPTALGPPPANAYVTDWWPQPNAMTEAALVIGHGGFGTTMTAIQAGVPQIVLPLFSSDQFLNAERIDAAGVGVQLLDGLASVPALPAAVEEVLGQKRYRVAAQAVADEMAALPDVTATVDVLADLAQR